MSNRNNNMIKLNGSGLPFDGTFVDFCLNTIANFSFIAINKSAIEMTIANIDSILNGLSDFSNW